MKKLLSFIKNDLFKALARSKYAKDICTVEVSDSLSVRFYLVYDRTDMDAVDWNYFKAHGWSCKEVKNSEPYETGFPIYIADNFWCCGCDTQYIQHMVWPKCPNCGVGHTQETVTVANIKTLTKWRL